MKELKEKLLVAISQASVEKAGLNLAATQVQADAIVQLANAIIEKVKEDK